MLENHQALDGKSLRHVLGHYPTGVCVITASASNGSHIGFVVGTFNSVSLEPPLVGFFADKRSSSWARIGEIGKFCVNILSDEQQHLCRRFAGKEIDKFSGIPFRLSANGSPILDGVVAWIDCSVEAVHEAGDHDIALGRVTALSVESPADPMIFLKGELLAVGSASAA